MGNHCQSGPENLPHDQQLKECTIWSEKHPQDEIFQEFDNPKRKVLESNFLKGQQCSSNDLSHKQTLGTLETFNRISLYKMESLSGELDTSLSSNSEDNIIQTTKPNRSRKRNTISFEQDFSQLKNKTIFRSAKEFILSERFIYEPMQIHPSKFIQVKKKNIESFYKFCQKIGEGTFGSVYKSLCKRTNQYRAIKILKRKKNKKKTSQQQQFRLQQLQVLRILDHPNIIKLFEVYYWGENYYLVTEFCEGGSILSFLKTNNEFSENIVKRILKQILSALKYLHTLKIAHRDLKLENIVFTKKINKLSKKEDIHIKIIDFGESLYLKLPHNNKDRREIGTITYMAPQVLEGMYSQKCDIWSCGVIAHILLTGKSPFKRFCKNQTIKCIKAKQISFVSEQWEVFPNNLKVLISQMLERNPLKRISAAQALTSSWLKQTQEKINNQKMKDILGKLYSYYRENNLISVIESYITFLKITQDQRAQITELFNKLDTDNSGTIQMGELKEAFVTCIGKDENDVIQQILKKLDRNGSRKIDLNQFITAIYGPQNIFHQNSLNLAFQYFDIDNSGYIDKNELKKALKGCNQRHIKFLLKQIDENEDGKISKKEFINYMKNRANQ